MRRTVLSRGLDRKLRFEKLDRRDLLSIAPVDDLYCVSEDQPIILGPEGGVLANDPAEAALAALVEAPSHGRLFLNPNGAFAYDPAPDFVGEDRFTYRLGNGNPEATANVALLVSADSSGIDAVDDSYVASKNRDLQIDAGSGLLANDENALFCELVAPPSHGMLVLGPDGSFRYTPNPQYVGEDAFLYRAASLDGADVGQVTIGVVNDSPVAVDDAFDVQEDGTLDVSAPGLLANDTDVNGDPLAIGPLDLIAPPEHGSLTLNPDGSFRYTPDADYNGPDHFAYRASDGELSSAEPATVMITVVAMNDRPAAVAQEGTTTLEDTSVTGALSGEDQDPEAEQALTFALAVGPEFGEVTIDPFTGEFVYVPDPDYNGPDGFSFTVTDDDLAGEPAGLTSEPAWVAITVTAVNDQPAAVGLEGLTTAEDTSASGTLSGEDQDPEVEQALTFALAGDPVYGNVTIDPITGQFVFSPVPDYVGTAAGFYFTVTDDGLAGETAGLTSEPAWVAIIVTPVNDRPVAASLEGVTAAEDTSASGTLNGEDQDPEVEQALTFALAVGPEFGEVTIDPFTGEFVYVPDPDYNGPDGFSFTVTDDDLAGEAAGLTSEPAWVTICVTPVADPVIANDDFYFAEQNTALIVLPPDGLLANDEDTDGNAVTGLFTLPQHGDVILQRDGSFGYMPDPGYSGEDSFVYIMANSVYGSQATVRIFVNEVPVAEDDMAVTDQDTPLSVPAPGVLGNDSDDFWGTLSAQLETEPENGTLLFNSDGSFSYTPDEGFYGEDSFTYRAFDGYAYSEEATVAILVNAIPLAEDDTAITDQDTPLSVPAPGVLGNDSDDFWGTLGAELVEGPEYGTLLFSDDGSFTYTPDEGFYGEDAFTYRAVDGWTHSDAATVTIVVNAIPVAEDDTAVTDQDTPLVLLPSDALSNDLDAYWGELSAEVVGDPEHGTLEFNLDGTATYTPDEGFYGEDSFTYRAFDTRAYSNEATVTILVNAIPLAENDTAITDQDTPLSVPGPGVLGNDSDDFWGTLSAEVAADPEHGTLLLSADGSFTYTPDEGFCGEDTFTYRAFDGRIYSDEATVTVTVNATPLAEDDTAITNQDTPLSVPGPGVLGNDSDDFWGTLSAEVVGDPEQGTLLLSADGSFTYTPDEGYYGEDAFTYQTFDGRAYSNEATVTILVNAIPVAEDDTAVTDQDTPLVLLPSDALGNDWDPYWGTLSPEVASDPEHGTLEFNLDGTATYTPDEGFYGEDSFTYRAFDTRAYSNEATVTILVNAIPLAEDDTAITEQDTPLSVPGPGVLGNDSDEFWGTLSAEVVGDPENGTLLLNADGSFTYTPDEGFHGEDTFTYRTFDGRIYSDEATVTVTVNAIPLAEDDTAITDQDTPLSVPGPGVLGNDSDDFWGTLSAALVGDPGHGTLLFSADGSFAYTPDEGFYGEDTFTYRAFDGRVYSNEATVTITVNATPVAEDDTAITDQDTPLSVPAPGVLGNDSDDFWGTLSAELVDEPDSGALVFNPDGSFTYTPDEGFYGEDSFTYQASDGWTHSNEATVTITVNATPVAEDDTAITDQDTPLILSESDALSNDWDPYWGTLSAEVVGDPEHGTLEFDLDGTAIYTPDEGFYGEDTFTYRAFDGRVYSNEATVTILVNAIPAAEDDAVVTDQDTPLTVAAPGALANDSDGYWGTMTAVLEGDPEHGTLEFHDDGSFTYTPAEGFSGEDTFSYRAFDGRAYSDVATVTVTVNGLGLPGANDDEYSVVAGQFLEVSAPGPLGNDANPAGSLLTMSLVQAPRNFSFFAWSKTGRFAYLPRPGFLGVDTFTYRASDGGGTSNLGTVRITVTPDGPTLTCGAWIAGAAVEAVADLPGSEDLRAALNVAVATWVDAGIPARAASALSTVELQWFDLPGNELARAANRTIYLDYTAAGRGWFWDSDGAAAERQTQAVDPRAVDRIDLLTVLLHELGHVAGLPDIHGSNSDLMGDSLRTGTRRLPGEKEVARIFAQQDWLD